MKKILLIVAGFLFAISVFSQTDSLPETKNNRSSINPGAKANDHLMIQFGYAGWSGTPDSINTSGLPRSFNIYFMLAFPFKTNPRFSVAIGPGIGTDNIYFDKTYAGIKDATSTLRFQNLADTNHFKKYKLVTAWLEAPVEIRFSSDPENYKRGVKVALGAKVGTLLSAHVKGKNLVNKDNNQILAYTQKEKSKHFFNTTRLSVIGRIGWGNFTLYGSYQINPLFKEGVGPDIKPYSIGLTLSGL